MKIVEATFVRVSPIMALRVRGREIRTTAEHPFFVEGKGWCCAREIEIGERLLSHDGQWVTVESVTDLDEVATVYNLRVSDHHTYFVGCNDWGFSVWSHNTICGGAVEQAIKSELGDTASRLSTQQARLLSAMSESIAAEYRAGNYQRAEELIRRIPGLDGDAATRVVTSLRRQLPIVAEEGLARTRTIRQGLNVGGARSVAFADVAVEGLPIEVVAFSGESGRGGLETAWRSRNPGSIVAQPTTLPRGLGFQDAEVKVLEELRTLLEQNPNARGTIRLFIDQPESRGACQNCTNAILRLRRDFGNRINLLVSAN